MNMLVYWVAGLAIVGTIYTYLLTCTMAGRRLNASPKALPFLTVLGCLPPIVALGFLTDWQTAATGFCLFAAVGLSFVIRGIWRIASDIVSEAEYIQALLVAMDDKDL